MTISRDSSLREVAFIICTAFHKHGTTVILTGGSAATVYAPDVHQSLDLDFIVQVRGPVEPSERVISELGYRRVGQEYHHRENSYTVDFPPGPLMVGDEYIHNWKTLRERHKLLNILEPTDCCRDRLASFLFWNDRSALEQAIGVAREHRNSVDFERIRAWCRAEKMLEKFEVFRQRV